MTETKNNNVMAIKTEIHIATNQEEINHFQHFVFNRYCLDMGWFNPDDYPQKMILDKYDDFSTFFLVYKDKKLVGGTRLVRDSKYGFPHEFVVGGQLPEIAGQTEQRVKDRLSKTPRNKIMEVTKTIGTSFKNPISKDLGKLLYWFGTYRDITGFYMVIDMDFFKLCHKLSAPIHPIGTPGFIDGSWSVPGILFTDELGANIKDNNPDFWNYINNQSNLFGNWKP